MASSSLCLVTRSIDYVNIGSCVILVLGGFVERKQHKQAIENAPSRSCAMGSVHIRLLSWALVCSPPKLKMPSNNDKLALSPEDLMNLTFL